MAADIDNMETEAVDDPAATEAQEQVQICLQYHTADELDTNSFHTLFINNCRSQALHQQELSSPSGNHSHQILLNPQVQGKLHLVVSSN